MAPIICARCQSHSCVCWRNLSRRAAGGTPAGSRRYAWKIPPSSDLQSAFWAFSQLALRGSPEYTGFDLTKIGIPAHQTPNAITHLVSQCAQSCLLGGAKQTNLKVNRQSAAENFLQTYFLRARY